MSDSIIVSKLRHGFLVTLRDRETGEGFDDVAACSDLHDVTTWMREHFGEPAPTFHIDARGGDPDAWAKMERAIKLRAADFDAGKRIHERPSHSDESSPEAGPQAEASLVGTDTGTPADREGRHEGEAAQTDLPTDQPETAFKLPAQESGGTEASSESEPLHKPNAARPASVDAHVNDGSAAGEVAHEVVTGGESAATSAETQESIAEDEAAPVSIFGELTNNQRKVLDHLRRCAVKTESEVVTIETTVLADKAGVPRGSIFAICQQLDKKGLIGVKRISPGVAPTITVHGALDSGRGG